MDFKMSEKVRLLSLIFSLGLISTSSPSPTLSLQVPVPPPFDKLPGLPSPMSLFLDKKERLFRHGSECNCQCKYKKVEKCETKVSEYCHTEHEKRCETYEGKEM